MKYLLILILLTGCDPNHHSNYKTTYRVEFMNSEVDTIEVYERFKDHNPILHCGCYYSELCGIRKMTKINSVKVIH